MDLRRHLNVLATAIMCGLALPLLAQTPTPPPNDDYENRTQLTGDNITFSGTTVGATTQADEFQATYFQWLTMPTVWWTWTAPATGQVSIDLISYSDPRICITPGYIAVWANVDWPNRTGENQNGTVINNVGHQHFMFDATAGMNYDIQVMAAAYGTFTLRLIQTNAPIILVPPQNRLVKPGGSTFLGVVVGDLVDDGFHPGLTFQWRLNGTNIPNQTWQILSLDNFDSTMVGSYTVLVSNLTTAAESRAAVVGLRTNVSNATLSALGANAGSIEFQLSGMPLTGYRIESSTNLIDWQAEETFPWAVRYQVASSVIYNRDGQAIFSIFPVGPQKFMRAVPYSPSFDPNTSPPGSAAMSEVCINNLRKIRFSKELWANQRWWPDWYPNWCDITIWYMPSLGELLKYMQPVACPYYTAASYPPQDDETPFEACYYQQEVDKCPICIIGGPAHVLEEPPDSE